MNLLARYSYVLVSLAILGATGYPVFRHGGDGLWVIGLLAVLASLVTLWVLARRGQTPANPEKRLKKSLGAGRPLVVHFYSDYALQSLLSRPWLSALERRCRGRVEFLYLSMLDPHVRVLAARLQTGLGGTVVYDARGQEVGRGRPAAALARLLERPAHGP